MNNLWRTHGRASGWWELDCAGSGGSARRWCLRGQEAVLQRSCVRPVNVVAGSSAGLASWIEFLPPGPDSGLRAGSRTSDRAPRLRRQAAALLKDHPVPRRAVSRGPTRWPGTPDRTPPRGRPHRRDPVRTARPRTLEQLPHAPPGLRKAEVLIRCPLSRAGPFADLPGMALETASRTRQDGHGESPNRRQHHQHAVLLVIQLHCSAAIGVELGQAGSAACLLSGRWSTARHDGSRALPAPYDGSRALPPPY